MLARSCHVPLDTHVKMKILRNLGLQILPLIHPCKHCKCRAGGPSAVASVVLSPTLDNNPSRLAVDRSLAVVVEAGEGALTIVAIRQRLQHRSRSANCISYRVLRTCL